MTGLEGTKGPLLTEPTRNRWDTDGTSDVRARREWAIEQAQAQKYPCVVGCLRSGREIPLTLPANFELDLRMGEWLESRERPATPDEVLAFAQKLERYVLTGEIK